MKTDAYESYCKAIERSSWDPVLFRFTEEEVKQYDIEGPSETTPFGEKVEFNLSERGRPFIRAALIFEAFSGDNEL